MRQQPERLGEQELVENALDLGEEAVVVVIAPRNEHAQRRRARARRPRDRREARRRTEQHAPLWREKRVTGALGAGRAYALTSVPVAHDRLRPVSRSRLQCAKPWPSPRVRLALSAAAERSHREPREPPDVVPAALFSGVCWRLLVHAIIVGQPLAADRRDERERNHGSHGSDCVSSGLVRFLLLGFPCVLEPETVRCSTITYSSTVSTVGTVRCMVGGSLVVSASPFAQCAAQRSQPTDQATCR